MSDVKPATRHQVLMAIGAHRDGWVNDFFTVSYAVAQAILDGRITAEMIASYPTYAVADGYPARESERLAGLAGVEDASHEDIGVSVEALRGLMTGDLDEGWDATWQFADYEDFLAKLGTTVPGLIAAVRGLSLTEAASIIAASNTYFYEHGGWQ